ncbi:SigE family RNA polymerase sigma factor [Cryptosporangium sp. NPDC048952]|uniref:SigE family RNA polymerase sigma factor n=1 Tax=Cryptosporangium sp. NPDC048952 TaxID=3363961 RepID=UPI003721F26F
MPDQRDAEYLEYVRSAVPKLRRLAFVLTQDAHRGDDLVQNTLLKLFTRWGRARRVEDLDAYARKILVRMFLSDRRTGWAQRVQLFDDVPERPQPESDPSTRMVLSDALATLPPKQRATLVLRFYADLSVEQAATALGCPVGTVKSHTARGLAALRRALPDDASNQARS